jgi:glutamate dehydrogenase
MQAHSDVAEALARLRELGAVRRPDDPVLGEFLSLYYFELPEDDVGDRKIDDIYAVGVAHLDLGRQRELGTPVVRVVSPDRERDGWQSPHSVVLMVTDDMPFLVDTMRMVLERHGLDVHLLVHPMLTVERDATGVMQGVAPFADRSKSGGHAVVEAWTQIEIDRVDDDTASVIEGELLGAVRVPGGDRRRLRRRRLRDTASRHRPRAVARR